MKDLLNLIGTRFSDSVFNTLGCGEHTYEKDDFDPTDVNHYYQFFDDGFCFTANDDLVFDTVHIYIEATDEYRAYKNSFFLYMSPIFLCNQQ